MEREADGATEKHEECEEMELAARAVAGGRVSARVAAEVKETGDDVDEAEESRESRVLEAANEEHGEEDGQKLEAVLVASLYTVERLCVLVLALEGVHRRVGHVELLASHSDLKFYTREIYTWKNQYEVVANLSHGAEGRGTVEAYPGLTRYQEKVRVNSFVMELHLRVELKP